jgi:hypothetical protein
MLDRVSHETQTAHARPGCRRPRTAVIFFHLSLTFCMVSCSGALEQTGLQSTSVQVVSCDLFQGNTSRLAPHLHFDGSACARIDVIGGLKSPILLELLVWQDGKLVDTRGPVQGVIRRSGEVTFSLQREIRGPTWAESYLATIWQGDASVTRVLPLPRISRDTFGFVSSRPPMKKVELQEGKPMLLWWKYSISDKGKSQADPAEAAQKAEWGAVLKLSLRKWTEAEKTAGLDKE